MLGSTGTDTLMSWPKELQDDHDDDTFMQEHMRRRNLKIPSRQPRLYCRRR
jgi:hypothetical protein